jgi:hypothetical protein
VHAGRSRLTQALGGINHQGEHMEPIHWAIVFLVACILVSFIATKKGRSGTLLFLAMAAPAIPLMLLISYALGDNIAAKPLAGC